MALQESKSDNAIKLIRAVIFLLKSNNMLIMQEEITMLEKAIEIIKSMVNDNKVSEARKLFDSIVCICAEGPDCVENSGNLFYSIMREAEKGYRLLSEIKEND